MIDKDALVATLKIFGICALVIGFIFLVVWAGVWMYKNGYYYAVGTIAGLLLFLLFVYCYYELKGL